MIGQLKQRLGLDENQCDRDLCDEPPEPNSEICWTHLRANAQRGVVDGDIAAAWYLFCDGCDREKPWIAIQDHGTPDPRDVGDCPHCGSGGVAYREIDTAAVEQFDEYIEEIQS